MYPFVRGAAFAVLLFGMLTQGPLALGQDGDKPVAKKKSAAKTSAGKKSFTDFRSAMSFAYDARQAGKLKKSRNALEAALELATKQRERCDAHRMLVSVYPETQQPQKMYESAEYIIANAPYPAFASLTVRSMLAIVQRKGLEEETVQRYAKQLEEKPNNRPTIEINEQIAYLVQGNHKRRGELLQRLIDLDKAEGKEVDPELFSNRAFAYRLDHEYVKAAQLYESTSLLSKDLYSHSMAEAAVCWKKADNADKSLAAAMNAHSAGPGKKSRSSLYQYHRKLADLFLVFKKRDEAIHHFELALAESPIDAYKKQCQEMLGVAKALKE